MWWFISAARKLLVQLLFSQYFEQISTTEIFLIIAIIVFSDFTEWVLCFETQISTDGLTRFCYSRNYLEHGRDFGLFCLLDMHFLGIFFTSTNSQMLCYRLVFNNQKGCSHKVLLSKAETKILLTNLRHFTNKLITIITVKSSTIPYLFDIEDRSKLCISIPSIFIEIFFLNIIKHF